MSYTITTKTQLVSVSLELTGDQVAALAKAAPELRVLCKGVVSSPTTINTAALSPALDLLEGLERIHTANSASRPTKGRRSRSPEQTAGSPASE